MYCRWVCPKTTKRQYAAAPRWSGWDPLCSARAIIIDNNKAFYYNSNEISKGDRYVVRSFRDPETGGRYLIIKGQDKELVVIPDKDTYYKEIFK